MRWNRKLWVGAVLVMTMGCDMLRRQSDDYLAAIPDEDGLQVEVTGSPEESGQVLKELQQQAPGDIAEFLIEARTAVQALNHGVRDFVRRLFAFAESTDYVQDDARRIYGPRAIDDVQYRLTVGKLGNRYGWKLEAAPAQAPVEELEVVAAGGGVKGDAPNRGRGGAGFNLDRYASIDPTFTGQGQLLVGYAHSGENRALGFAASDFTPNVANHEPVTAALVGSRSALGVYRIRFAGKANLEDSATDAKENIAMRVRFHRGLGGRADLLATGGDVPEGKVWFASACWDAGGQEGFKIVRECVQGQLFSCETIMTRGALENCLPGLQNAEPPTEAPTDPSPEPESPVDTEPVPGTFPSGD